MPNMQASPRNSLLGYLSDKLATGKGYANKYEILPQIPLLGGTGLGDLFLGKSPELLDDMSYNMSSAIRGGNRATGGLGTYTLDKRSADLGMTMADMYGLSKGLTSLGKYGAKKLIDKSGFDETRRAFLEGKAKGLAEPINDTVSTSIDAINGVLQKPISRRDLMKKSAAVAGGGAALTAAPSLLRNFAKEAEHTIPKVAEHAADNVAVNTAKKYKYNTLKEYLDKVREIADEEAAIQHAERGGDSLGLDVPEEWSNDWMKKLLKDDEFLYNEAKKHQNFIYDEFGHDPQAIGLPRLMDERLNAFSPQAKQEMKAFKEWSKGRDLSWLENLHKDPKYSRHMDLADEAEMHGIDPYTIPKENWPEGFLDNTEVKNLRKSYEGKRNWVNGADYDLYINPNLYTGDVPF